MKIKKIYLKGIIVLFLLGSIFHFLYNLTNDNFIVGLFSPINESIWEHTKLVFVPYILYYFIGYINNKKIIDKNKWFTSLLIGIVLSIILIPSFYYTYSNAFGFESLIVDIFILLIVNIISQLISYHVYKYLKNPINYKIIFLVLLMIFLIYIIFTIFPPNLPLFN